MPKRPITTLTVGLVILANTCAQNRPASSVVIRKHMALKFALIQPLSSATAKVHDEIPLRLARPLIVQGTVVLPEGWMVQGRIRKVTRARKGRDGEIEWTVSRIPLRDSAAVKAKILFVNQNPDAIVDDRYERKPGEGCPDVCGKDAAGLLLMTIVALPVLLPMIIFQRDHADYSVGSEYFLPAGSTVAVVVTRDHRVHF